jgi:probable F420-dependent oxidoreductase
MQYGVLFPQTEFPPDAAAVRDFAQAVRGLGFAYIAAYEHVLGANPASHGNLDGPYTYLDPFLEPFALFGFMAAAAPALGFATSVIILPQRQTALVAKQAATLDVLCEGKLRLGVGLGWNAVEYEALGHDFHTRGRRIEEQVDVMRRLWTEPLVTYTGQWHTITHAGLNPLPLQQPVPVWFGGHAEPALRRAARLGDGWMPNSPTPDAAVPYLQKLDGYLAEAGRTRQEFGLEARFAYGNGQPATWIGHRDRWRDLGATHISLNTMRAGFSGPADHLRAIEAFSAAMNLSRTH